LTTLLVILTLLQGATAGLVVLLLRRQRVQFDRLKHVTRTELHKTAGEIGERVEKTLAALRDRQGRERKTLAAEIGKRAHKAALATGQQMEWRAHLSTLLDLPFGALPATRHWAASPDLLVHLALLVRERKPALVVECGGGVSTLVLARALQLNGAGLVWTLESSAEFAQITRERLRRLGVQQFSKVRIAPLTELPPPGQGFWYRLEEIARLPGPIDMLFVDGPQVSETTSRAPAIDHLFPRLSPAGFVVFDDARRADEAGFPARIAKRFPALVRTDLPAEKGAWLFAPPAQS
jgi:predicted O-methyltransferase YrrM